MNEEKLRILRMLEDGKITAADAARLIEALEKTESRPSERDIRKRWLHVVVTEDGEKKVNVKVPLALLKFGFRIAPHIAGMKFGKSHGSAASREAREAAREKVRAAKERIREMKARLRDGEIGVDLESMIGDTIEDALEEALESTDMDLGSVVQGLDLDTILEMARDADFDGKLVDIHDDDEHVVVTLE